MEKYNLEKISLYKLFFTVLITAFYGVVGWFFINRNSMNTADRITLIFVITFLIFAGIAVIYKARYYINQLKDGE